MPVNYERAPWDKNNSLAVRLVNQRLSEIQRKAAFVDSFLHAPRIALYINEEAGYFILYVVLHPAYPVATAITYVTPGPFTVPPGEIAPTFTSVIHSLFDWTRVPFEEVYYRSTDPVGATMFNRWLRGQYQDAQGHNTLLSPVGAVDGWQSFGLYTQYLECLVLCNDLLIGGPRQEAAWNLDQLWNNKKFLLGRSYEKMPEDGNIFYSPPAEADNQDDGFETPDSGMSKSEEYFPKLPGYHVDYIDSLGVFAPNNYTIDAVLTHMLYEDIQKKYPKRAADMETMVILKQGTLGNNWDDKNFFGFVDAFKIVPGAGQVIGMAEGMTRMAGQYKFWPRAYAFGRQYMSVLSPYQCRNFHQFYYANYQSRLLGPRINSVDEPQFSELAHLLAARNYVDASYFPGWI